MEFIDLKRQYRRMEKEIKEAVEKVLESGRFILGEEVELFERELAEFLGVKYAITCGSGTDGLMLALMAIGVGSGDEVIVPAFTFFATAEVVALLGAKPVFVDIDPATYNIDPSLIERSIGKRTKAIIAVSLYGQCPDLDPIMELAEKFGIFVIEDAAQSFGATYKGRKSCSIAHISVTSFFPAKPLGAYGDGGAVFTDDEEIAIKIKALRNHGQIARYDHRYIGLNSRLDTIQAAVLRVKLRYFEEEVDLRQVVAGRYDSLLREIGIEPPYVADYNTSVYAQYTIRIKDRDRVVEKLSKFGIPTAVHYPKPLPYQPAFGYLGYVEGSFPESERASREVISLPFHPYIGIDEQYRVVEALKEVLKG
ncbi:MAG: DegT/DnrJ/EryC1/StrS family aminotransferase [Thermosulfidibacteraceae bacterium]|jgi:UDP-2-acetamido-2-deoxy-ribo-hexuluronate aminotransferase